MKTHLTIAALAFFTAAHAQDYPAKPIRLVVPYSPGGPVDIVGRLTAQKLTDELKQQVIVDNRAGGGGNIAVEIVARSLPDGYTLLMGANGTNAINPNLYPKLTVKPARDLVPIGMKNGTPHALDAVAIAVALLMPVTPALAQVRDFPAKPLRIIVPTAPGGIVDLVTRILGQRLTELTGQIAIVENKAGASTNIGMRRRRADFCAAHTTKSAALWLTPRCPAANVQRLEKSSTGARRA